MVEPVFPVNNMVVELPVQIVAGVAVAEPPTDTGLTITVATALLTDEQAPLVTTAL
jgi:hypothetical protein